MKIRMLMVERNLNIRKLAELMKTAGQWLGKVLRLGTATPEYVCRIAQALEVYPEEIIKWED